MELEDRGAYRAAILRCPGCGEAMRVEATTDACVEVCDACGGLWIDWFDGEVQAIAAETEAKREASASPSQPPAPPRGSAGCPRCQRELAAEHHRFTDAREGEALDGVEILRCADCLGCFVPRPSALLLFDRRNDPRPASLGEALVAFLRQLFVRSAD